MPSKCSTDHVLGFKGLERRAVVLVVNEESVRTLKGTSLRRLSRARDQLVVCSNLRRASETPRPAETELATVPAELFQIRSLFETVSAIDRRDGSGVARCFSRKLHAGSEAEFVVDVG